MVVKDSHYFSTCFKSVIGIKLLGAGLGCLSKVWVTDIVKFNLGRDRAPSPIKFIKPGALPCNLHARLETLRYKTWGAKSNLGICRELNLPTDFAYSPIEYKYVFEFHKKYGDLEIMQRNISDKIICAPLQKKELKSFIEMF